MKLTKTNYAESDEIEFRLKINGSELMQIKFNKFDYALIDECEKSSTISDTLLALEMIARKIEESQGNLGVRKSVRAVGKLIKPKE